MYQQIRTKLTQLELERDSLLQRYTADDRLVKDKETEIDELKKRLETVKETSVGSESISLNDVHRRILNELLQARVQLRGLNEKKVALTRQVESYSATAADKKRKGFEYDRLLREVNAKKENLDLYKKRAEEARISDAMDERKFSNAYILERASLPLAARELQRVYVDGDNHHCRYGSSRCGSFRLGISQQDTAERGRHRRADRTAGFSHNPVLWGLYVRCAKSLQKTTFNTGSTL